MPSRSTTTTSPGSMSRTYSASIRSSAQVSDANTVAVAQPAHHQRPEAPGVARGDERLGRQEQQREGAHHLVEARRDRVLEPLAVAARVEVQDHLGVRGGLEDRARRLELLAQDRGVHEVAVVADRDRAAVALDQVGLRVRRHGLARGRVAHVADRAVPGERLEPADGEHVVDEAHALLEPEPRRRRGDARGLLAAVLQRVEPHVGEVCGLGVTEDAEEPALVVEVVVLDRLVPERDDRPLRGGHSIADVSIRARGVAWPNLRSRAGVAGRRQPCSGSLPEARLSPRAADAGRRSVFAAASLADAMQRAAGLGSGQGQDPSSASAPRATSRARSRPARRPTCSSPPTRRRWTRSSRRGWSRGRPPRRAVERARRGRAGRLAARVAAARDLAAFKPIALADPEAVPAGVYARKWLEGLGLWAQDRAEGRADARRARGARRRRVGATPRPASSTGPTPPSRSGADRFRGPREQGPPILYPVAPLARSRTPAAAAFVAIPALARRPRGLRAPRLPRARRPVAC